MAALDIYGSNYGPTIEGTAMFYKDTTFLGSVISNTVNSSIGVVNIPSNLIVTGNITVGGSSLDSKINNTAQSYLTYYYTKTTVPTIIKNTITTLSGTAACVPVLSWVGNNAYVSQIFTTSNSLFVKSYLNINNVNDPLNAQVQIGLSTALALLI